MDYTKGPRRSPGNQDHPKGEKEMKLYNQLLLQGLAGIILRLTIVSVQRGTCAIIKVESEGEVAQLCPTFCNPMDCSLPGSSAHGIFQAGVLEWLPFPSLGDLPDPGIEPGSPSLQADTLPFEPPGKPIIKFECCVCIPDLSGYISGTLGDMKGQVKVMSDDNLPFWTSVLSLVKGDWWKTIFTIVIVALMVLLCGPFILQ